MTSKTESQPAHTLNQAETNTMRGVLLYGPGDARVEDREIPVIVEPTDAILKVTAACICLLYTSRCV